MKKILLSWIAFNNDFKENKEQAGLQVNELGPTFLFHKYFFEGYEKHILLSGSKGNDTKIEFLINHIRHNFSSHEVVPQYMSITDVISHEEISAKIEALLLSLRECEIDIFISPGTSAMQTSWILAHMSLGLKTRLIQTRPSKFTQNKDIPERLFVNIDKDKTTASVLIRAAESEEVTKVKEHEFLETESITPVYEKAYKIAQANEATVLIQGATGTGKEHLAKYIHENSYRRHAPFIPVNCSAIGKDLLESRLFGYTKGAFTDAKEDTQGILQKANGGTVFLDEIGDTSPEMQQALLRVLQEKEVRPIGGKIEKIDVRFIAASNKELTRLCEEGKFRWDFYYRLAVVDLELPTLQERGLNEIKALIQFFLKQKKKTFKVNKALKLPKPVLDRMLAYPFPGNIRELENLIERLYVLHTDGIVNLNDLPKRILHPKNKFSMLLKDAEKLHIEKILKINKFNQKKTARDLGVAYNTLKKKIGDYGIVLFLQMD